MGPGGHAVGYPRRSRPHGGRPAGVLFRRRGPALGGCGIRGTWLRGLGASPAGGKRRAAELQAARLPARHRRRHRGHRRHGPPRIDHLYVYPRRVHGAPDPLGAHRRTGGGDASRGGERPAADHLRLVPAAPQAHVARGPDDEQRRVEGRRARLRAERRGEAVRRRPRRPARPGPLGDALPGGAARRAGALRDRAARGRNLLLHLGAVQRRGGHSQGSAGGPQPHRRCAPRVLQEDRRALPGAHRRARLRSKRPMRASTRRSRGPRSASTRAS